MVKADSVARGSISGIEIAAGTAGSVATQFL
jgi:hypothetical protein